MLWECLVCQLAPSLGNANNGILVFSYSRYGVLWLEYDCRTPRKCKAQTHLCVLMLFQLCKFLKNQTCGYIVRAAARVRRSRLWFCNNVSKHKRRPWGWSKVVNHDEKQYWEEEKLSARQPAFTLGACFDSFAPASAPPPLEQHLCGQNLRDVLNEITRFLFTGSVCCSNKQANVYIHPTCRLSSYPQP